MARSKSLAPIADAREFFKASEQSGNARVQAGRDVVSLSNLQKVYWKPEGFTKYDLLKYYYTIFDTIFPYITQRPLILKRYPNGITGQMFYQHNIEYPPSLIETFPITQKDGSTVNYAIVNDIGDLLYIVNLGTIAQNPFHSTIDHLDKPDYFVFDLDPGDTATFEQVKMLALEVKKVLDEVGLTAYPKTSGSTGIHIYVPIKPEYSYDEVVVFAKEIARIVTLRNPEDATIERMTRKRKKSQIYVDYLQNLEGKSIAAAYSVREKPGATVSAPLEWKEINKRLRLDMFTIETMPGRIKRKGDLFAPVLKKKQSLRMAIKRLAKLSAEYEK